MVFDIVWAGDEVSPPKMPDPLAPVHVEPHRLLSRNEDPAGETVVMTTSDKEQYQCVLPQLTSEERSDSDGHTPTIAELNSVLGPLRGQCISMLEGYWAYELCHWHHLRQYHQDEKPRDGKTPGKLTEYVLGNMDGEEEEGEEEQGEEEEQVGGVTKENDEVKRAGKEEQELKENELKKLPMWYYNGVDYPYHRVQLGDGTPCEPKPSVRRRASIQYICLEDSHLFGTFLTVEEVSMCEYTAVIGTQQLCKLKAFETKKNPVHTISCFAGEGSPRQPKRVLEHTMASQHLMPLPLFQTIPPGIHLLPPQPPKGAEVPTLLETTPNTGSVQIDKQFVESFLSGEACLSGGGSSWWQHQVCFGLNVKQLHKDAVSYQEVYLGRWDEKAHKEWFSKAGKRKQSKNHVIHLYVNGDVCKESGVVRNCQVKFKCVPDARPSQITLYLEEPSLCSYVLTVEAGFICDLLQTVDEHLSPSQSISVSGCHNVSERFLFPTVPWVCPQPMRMFPTVPWVCPQPMRMFPTVPWVCPQPMRMFPTVPWVCPQPMRMFPTVPWVCPQPMRMFPTVPWVCPQPMRMFPTVPWVCPQPMRMFFPNTANCMMFSGIGSSH
ncbi:hypothetical protein EMCRGX_G026850 [Ephydatia muelleri]